MTACFRICSETFVNGQSNEVGHERLNYEVSAKTMLGGDDTYERSLDLLKPFLFCLEKFWQQLQITLMICEFTTKFSSLL